MSRTGFPFDPTELAYLHGTGYFGVPADKLEEIAAEIRAGESLFHAAWNCGIDPDNLTAEDRAAIRELVRDDDGEDE